MRRLRLRSRLRLACPARAAGSSHASTSARRNFQRLDPVCSPPCSPAARNRRKCTVGVSTSDPCVVRHFGGGQNAVARRIRPSSSVMGRPCGTELGIVLSRPLVAFSGARAVRYLPFPVAFRAGRGEHVQVFPLNKCHHWLKRRKHLILCVFVSLSYSVWTGALSRRSIGLRLRRALHQSPERAGAICAFTLPVERREAYFRPSPAPF